MDNETIERLRSFLLSTRGKMMHVTFRKRDPQTKEPTGELREMTCRHGVKKYKRIPYSPDDPIIISQDNRNALLRVFDVNAIDKKTGRKGAYRMIVLDGLEKIRAHGKEFRP